MSETLSRAQTANQAIVNLAAMSLSAAPGLTEAERTARLHTVIQGVAEFQPADMAQTILASLILGHHLTVMDGFRDIARGTMNPAEAARARMATVAETKIVPQFLRELRIERKEALTRATAERDEPTLEVAQGPAGEAGYEATIAKFLSTYTGTMPTPENTNTLTPEAAAKVREAPGQVMPLAPVATPRQEISVPGPVTGSRAQRRAMMKRNGAFKRTA
jgi:hypothetical protein